MKLKALFTKLAGTKVIKYLTTVVFGSKLGTTLLIIGIIFSVLSTILACIRSPKMKGVISTFKADRADYEKDSEAGIFETKKAKAKTIISVYANLVWGTIKVFLPVIICTAISVGCLLGSHNIMIKRTSEALAAVATVTEAYENYRARVREEYGEQVDNDFAMGIRRTETTVTETKASGKEVTKKAEEVSINNLPFASPYARLFMPQESLLAEKERTYNETFLMIRQCEANHRLQANGHLTLNEVYDMLGYEHTSIGAVVGWTYPKDDEGHYCGEEGKGFVDFGIYDFYNTSDGRRVIGKECGTTNAFFLDFNVEGVIWDKIDDYNYGNFCF